MYYNKGSGWCGPDYGHRRSLRTIARLPTDNIYPLPLRLGVCLRPQTDENVLPITRSLQARNRAHIIVELQSQKHQPGNHRLRTAPLLVPARRGVRDETTKPRSNNPALAAPTQRCPGAPHVVNSSRAHPAGR